MSWTGNRIARRTAGTALVLSIIGFAMGGLHPFPVSAESRAASQPAPTLADYEVQKLKLGGDFTLTNQDGKPTNLNQVRSKVVVLFFGYTYCPDVCPITMTKLDRVRKKLGKLAGTLQPVFVSIDPERDTPVRLKAYLANFDPGTIALTGTKEQIERAAGLYRARYEKEEVKSSVQYLMAHTAYIYMLDGTGKLRYIFPPDVDDALLFDATKKLAAER